MDIDMFEMAAGVMTCVTSRAVRGHSLFSAAGSDTKAHAMCSQPLSLFACWTLYCYMY